MTEETRKKFAALDGKPAPKPNREYVKSDPLLRSFVDRLPKEDDQ